MNHRKQYTAVVRANSQDNLSLVSIYVSFVILSSVIGVINRTLFLG